MHYYQIFYLQNGQSLFYELHNFLKIRTDPQSSPLSFIPRQRPLSTPLILTSPTATLMNSRIPKFINKKKFVFINEHMTNKNLPNSSRPMLLNINIMMYVIVLRKLKSAVQLTYSDGPPILQMGKKTKKKIISSWYNVKGITPSTRLAWV